MLASPFFVTNLIASAIVLILVWTLYTAAKEGEDFKLFLRDDFLDNVNPASYVVGALILVCTILSVAQFPLVSQGTLIFCMALGYGIFVHAFGRGLNVSSLGRSCVIFALMIFAANFCPITSVDAFTTGSIFGLCWARLIEMRLTFIPNPIQEITPACLWLVGVLVTVGNSGEHNVNLDILSVAICTACLMRLFQPPFLTVDYLFVKRLALAATGGMIMLVAIVRYFHMGWTNLAWLFGFGWLIAYLAETLDTVTARDNEKVRALFRAALVVAASVIAFIYQEIAPKSVFPVPLALAATMLTAESSQTAFIASFYWIAIALAGQPPMELTSALNSPDQDLLSKLPFWGGAFIVGSFAVTTYLSICMPDEKRTKFDWAEPLVFICLLAFAAAIVMAHPFVPAVAPTLLNVALALSIGHSVFFPKNPHAHEQCMLFILMFACLVYVFSLPAGALLPFGAMAAIFRPRLEAREVANA
jgi:hypothetical protein